MNYKVVCSGALPSAVRPRTSINDVIRSQVQRRLNGRIVKTRKTRIK